MDWSLGDYEAYAIMLNHARQLETELASANALIGECREALIKAREAGILSKPCYDKVCETLAKLEGRKG